MSEISGIAPLLRNERVADETALVRAALIGIAALFLLVILFLPLIAVFVEAFRRGFGTYLDSLADPDALAAIRLTLTVAFLAVSFNIVFGTCAAWAITKFHFRGRQLLLTLINLPFSVSPVISGLV